MRTARGTLPSHGSRRPWAGASPSEAILRRGGLCRKCSSAQLSSRSPGARPILRGERSARCGAGAVREALPRTGYFAALDERAVAHVLIVSAGTSATSHRGHCRGDVRVAPLARRGRLRDDLLLKDLPGRSGNDPERHAALVSGHLVDRAVRALVRAARAHFEVLRWTQTTSWIRPGHASAVPLPTAT